MGMVDMDIDTINPITEGPIITTTLLIQEGIITIILITLIDLTTIMDMVLIIITTIHFGIMGGVE